ncbi:MAG TPA: hybrid sensor histidine kinase/response regulator [Sulfitobacter sp.]|nr:hybrid sensor histidine kinase/response regulator [Sulfitobacter sp.]HBB83196.1 hybrid sensor histidine kinase/response regulator [Sulfitobacter sp.]
MNDAGRVGPTGARSRQVLMLILVVGMSIAAYLAYNIWDRIQALDSAQQDHAEWVFTQIEIEFLKTDRALAEAQSATPEALDELRKRFDIFYSRVLLAERVRNNAEAKPQIRELRFLLDSFLPTIDGTDAELAAALGDIDGMLRAVEDIPREIALASIAIASEMSQNERHEIVRLIEVMAAIVLIVTLALVGAVYRLSRQASRLNSTSQMVEENHLRLATTLQASLDAIVVINAQGEIEDFNGSAEEIFGITHEAAKGSDYISLLIPPADRMAHRERLMKFRQTGETEVADKGRREFEMIDQDGRIFPVEMSVSQSPSAQGSLFIAYIRDITEKRLREAEIIAARDEALDAYQEKSRFFAMMSHEMRTPLNGVISALQLLLDDRLDDEQKRYLDAAMTSGEILLGHINDVLAIERSEAGTYEQVRQACDMTALMAGIINTMEPLAEAGGTRLHLDLTKLDDKSIVTDPRAIQQVLVNLLSNAIKFSPGGDVTLRGWFAKADAGEEFLLQVEDDGSGIPADDIDRIFEDFVSLDSRYERRTGGTGLGLGIVRRLVKRLGGEITCESTVGEGTSFTLRLPVELAVMVETCCDETTDVHNKRVEQAPAQRLNLLLVDDNEINRELIKAMLERIGHDVTLATGGREAIDIAEGATFDAILMDISMPEVNGIQATKAILSGSGPNHATPIIAVTAHAMPKEREEFSAAGMSGFLQKPLDMKVLRAELREVQVLTAMPEKALRKQAQSVPTPIQGKSAKRPLLNDQQMVDLIDLLGEEKLRERVQKLSDQVADDLPALMAADALPDLQARAHAMAGMCGMLGADRLHGLLKEIETACKTDKPEEARGLCNDLPDTWNATEAAMQAQVGP